MGGTYRWMRKPFNRNRTPPHPPSQVCDICARFQSYSFAVNGTCCFCKTGIFRSARYFYITWCIRCYGADYCDDCHCTGMIAYVREDFSEAELAEISAASDSLSPAATTS